MSRSVRWPFVQTLPVNSASLVVGVALLTVNSVSTAAQRLPTAGRVSDTLSYVYLRNADTVAIERLVRMADGVQGELAAKGQARLVWYQHVGPGKATGAFDLEAFAPGTGKGATPLQRVTLRIAGDSGFMDVHASGNTVTEQRLSVPTGSQWMLNSSVVHSDVLASLARDRGESRVNIVLAQGAQKMPMTVRTAGDTLMVTIASSEGRFVHDALGLKEAHMGPGLAVRRVSAIDATRLFAPQSYAAPADAPYTAEDVVIRTTRGYDLAGTLTKPRGAGKLPVVITISGSGPQERDGMLAGISGYAIFRELADTLGRRGVAVLRVDDRGVGLSGGTESAAKATSGDFADDVRSAVSWLHERKDIDGDRIALAGHSEGGLIAPMIAASDKRIRAIALLAGPAYTGRRVLMYQNQDAVNQASQLTPTQRDSIMQTVPARLDSIGKATPWIGYFMQHDPVVTARSVSQPVLVLQGETDRQVSPEQADTLAAALRAGGNTQVTVRKFPATNHLFLADTVGLASGYAKLADRHVRKEVLGTLADWLVARFK